jgi:suppressor for copper-sensitivity B
MTVIKRFLGVALIASWVWLLSILANNIGLVGSIAVGGLTVLAAWLLLLGQRAFLVITATIVLAFLVPRLVGELSNKVTENNILSNSQYSNTDELNKLWKTFNEAAIPILVAQGKTVFVDVTADWCLTCQVNKRLVLDSKAILEILKSQNVIAMRADWTKPDRNISTYLSQYGRYGIPFNAIYGPDSPSGIVLPELLNKNKVLDAFFQASKTSKMPNEGITK